jgi:5'-deoxynucleotidase YfbR-like HD superfamily hydrolase
MESDRDVIAEMTADLLSLSNVHRWTVIATSRHQSVAEHSYRVAVISIELLARLGVLDLDSKFQTVAWALVHDWPETLTGDIDGKFKRMFPDIHDSLRRVENLTFPEYARMGAQTPVKLRQIVKVADYIEALTFIQEFGAGQRAQAVFDELTEILYSEAVPYLADLLPIGVGSVHKIVEGMLYRIDLDTHCIQMRAGPKTAKASKVGKAKG